MTPVWDRSPADWGWPQSSKQHKFEFEESRIAKLNIYIYIYTYAYWIVCWAFALEVASLGSLGNCTQVHNSCQFPREIIILYQQNSKTCVFSYFPGARSNRSNPTSYSFYLIGLLWSGDLRETSKLQNTVSFGSPLSLPNMENSGRAQPAMQCCTLHSLERIIFICGQTLSQKFKTSWKRMVFCTFWHKSVQFFVNFPEKLPYFISKTQKTMCFCIFSRGSLK